MEQTLILWVCKTFIPNLDQWNQANPSKALQLNLYSRNQLKKNQNKCYIIIYSFEKSKHETGIHTTSSHFWEAIFVCFPE